MLLRVNLVDLLERQRNASEYERRVLFAKSLFLRIKISFTALWRLNLLNEYRSYNFLFEWKMERGFE